MLAKTICLRTDSLLLVRGWQAIGKSNRIIGIGLSDTIIDLAAVEIGARPLGTTAGVIGRSLLAISMMTLSWWTLRRVLHVPLTHGLSKALLVSVCSAVPVAIIDYTLATNFHVTPLFRLTPLVIVFGLSFLVACRRLSVFTERDFELLENALPRILGGSLGILERFLVSRTTA